VPLTHTWHSESVDHTRDLAARLAREARPGDIFALYGDLASGKTTFVQGFCAALDVTEPVNSPTFTLINEYSGNLPVYHFDCYRLNDASDLISLGYEEYFYGEGIVLIEWAERVETLLPEYTIRLRFSHAFTTETARVIRMESPQTREELCVSWP